MKISCNDALVTAVTPIGENHGEEVKPAISLRIECQLPPRALNQLRQGLKEMFFDEQNVPRFPDLGDIPWKPEYEKANFFVEGLEFKNADIKKIVFGWADSGMLVNFAFTVKLNATESQRGKLTSLIKQETKIAIEKAVQKRIEEEEEDGGEAKDEKQAKLPGTEDSSKVTKDGEPITPLVQ